MGAPDESKISLDTLKINPKNPRIIKDERFKKLKKSIEDFNKMLELRPIIVDENNMIMGGNMRYQALVDSGIKEIPKVWVKKASDLTEDEKKEFIIKDNIPFGEWDMDILANEFEPELLEEWGFDGLDFGGELDEGLTDEDSVPEVPEEPKTKPGDLYQLGEHRLLCGDSTNIQHVERLIDGEGINAVFTDPPYGMNAVSKSGVLKEKYGTDILNDDSNQVAIDSFNLCKSLDIEKMVFWGANYYPECLGSSGCWIVWDKNNGSSDQADGELAWTNFKGVVRKFEKASEKINRVHPTQKPCELIEWTFVRWEFGINVLDLFGGSGSTLIACEKTSRKCRMIELDPKYCDVIVKRWEDFTGKKAELINNRI